MYPCPAKTSACIYLYAQTTQPYSFGWETYIYFIELRLYIMLFSVVIIQQILLIYDKWLYAFAMYLHKYLNITWCYKIGMYCIQLVMYSYKYCSYPRMLLNIYRKLLMHLERLQTGRRLFNVHLSSFHWRLRWSRKGHVNAQILLQN